MYPIVCMGPPNPATKPPPHGTRHCQKYWPVDFGVMKLNCITRYGTWAGVPGRHGDVGHSPGLSDWISPGVAIGTFTLMAGIENVCPTLQPDHELMSWYGLPSTYSTLPIVPVTWPQKLLRNGVQPSNP